MPTRETQQPPRRSARAAKIAETTRKKASVASSEENKAKSQPKEPPKKRKARGLAEEPPKKKKKRRSRGPTEHFRLRKIDLPLGKGISLRDQVKKEFAHLLKCDEPLVANKELGINAQRAQVNQTWEERFVDFLVFSKEYGHKHVPKMYLDNPALGRWVVKIRSWKKKNDKSLTSSRLKRLNAAGFMWDPKADPEFYKIQGDNEKAGDLWEENFAELVEYKKEHGDCMVPKSFPPNQRLARWVSRQRRHYKAKQEDTYHTLTDEKEKRLLDIGFVFQTRTAELLRMSALKQSEDKFFHYCEKLMAFKEEYGHCAVPRRWKKDTQLASWVMRQRIQWRNKQKGEHSYLNDERIEQLTQMGFVFGEIDRKIYPVPSIKPRSTPKANANDAAKRDTTRKTLTSKSSADDGAKRKSSRSTKTSISAGKALDEKEPDETGVAQGEGQLQEAVLEKMRKSASSKTRTNDAAKSRSSRRTKTSVSAEVTDESGVTQEEEQMRETVVVPSSKRRTPKTSENDAEKRKSPRSTKITISAKEAMKGEETGVTQGEEQLRQTFMAPPSKRGTAKTSANKAAKRKAEEALHEEEAGVSQGEEAMQKTVIAPPGSLGLIITNIAESKGTVVSDVRSSSVLADKISPGDRIIAIDGEDVSLMTASEISTIMAGKSNLERILTVRVPSPNQQFEFPPTKSSTKAKKKKKTTKLVKTGQSEIAVREQERMMMENAEAEAKRTNLQLIRAEREEAAAAIVGRQDKDAKAKQVTLPTASMTTPKETKSRIKWVIYAGKKK